MNIVLAIWAVSFVLGGLFVWLDLWQQKRAKMPTRVHASVRRQIVVHESGHTAIVIWWRREDAKRAWPAACDMLRRAIKDDLQASPRFHVYHGA